MRASNLKQSGQNFDRAKSIRLPQPWHLVYRMIGLCYFTDKYPSGGDDEDFIKGF